MKTCFLCTLISVSLMVSFAKADDHETFTGGLDPNAPINVQAQVCTLKPGKTQAQYDRLVNKYFEWAKKYDVEKNGGRFWRIVEDVLRFFGAEISKNPQTSAKIGPKIQKKMPPFFPYFYRKFSKICTIFYQILLIFLKQFSR